MCSDQTLNGLTTIRALGVVPVFVGKTNKFIDGASSVGAQPQPQRWCFAMLIETPAHRQRADSQVPRDSDPMVRHAVFI